jgi:hypothetical protein
MLSNQRTTPFLTPPIHLSSAASCFDCDDPSGESQGNCSDGIVGERFSICLDVFGEPIGATTWIDRPEQITSDDDKSNAVTDEPVQLLRRNDVSLDQTASDSSKVQYNETKPRVMGKICSNCGNPGISFFCIDGNLVCKSCSKGRRQRGRNTTR